MGIFGKKQDEIHEIELFQEGPNEKSFYFSNQKTLVRIDDYFIRISRQNTISNTLLQGLDGEKAILFNEHYTTFLEIRLKALLIQDFHDEIVIKKCNVYKTWVSFWVSSILKNVIVYLLL